jgi:hypothetical protein
MKNKRSKKKRRVFVKTLDGQRHKLLVDPEILILDLKKEI